MKPISIKKFAQIINAELINPASSLKTSDKITGVTTDSRMIKAGDCFFAIAGDKFDGHTFVDIVFSKGAACAVVSKDINTKYPKKFILKVTDTIEAFGKVAHYYRNELNSTVIGITGSVGKTTTRQIISNCLSRHFKAVQSPKSFNNNIGLPITILSAQHDTKIIVAEIGSNHPGEISILSKIASPDIALINNVHLAHLTGFGSIEAIIKEKVSITEGLRKNGALIVNADQPILLLACREKKIKKIITFGTTQNADITAYNIELLPTSSRFMIENTQIEVPLPGPGNCQNTLAAWAVCREFGIKLADFAASLKELPAVAMRAEILQIGQLTIINDCYNANPASMANALQILANFEPSGSRRLVFVCGDMNELGDDSAKLHTKLGEQIALSKVSLLITVGPLSQAAGQTAKEAAGDNIEVISYPDVKTACNNMLNFIKDTDIILVKGSRIIGLEAAAEALKTLFEVKSAAL
jgi:UDP-N-acetylmuramoyl-tripeptide--D-alanyl-D-alanine ligase